MVTADETVITSSEDFEVRSGPEDLGSCSTGQVHRGVLGVGRSGRIKQSRNGLSVVLETWMEEVEGIVRQSPSWLVAEGGVVPRSHSSTQ